MIQRKRHDVKSKVFRWVRGHFCSFCAARWLKVASSCSVFILSAAFFLFFCSARRRRLSLVPSCLLSSRFSPRCFPAASLWGLRVCARAGWACGGSAARWRPDPCWGGRETRSGPPSITATRRLTGETVNSRWTLSPKQTRTAAQRQKRWLERNF